MPRKNYTKLVGKYPKQMNQIDLTLSRDIQIRLYSLI
jgi:hypothetical protein